MTHPVVRTFDEVAEVYDEVLPFFRTFAAQFVAALDPTPGDRVLDLGAGTGAISAQALAHGCRVTAVDASAAMISRLRRELPGVTASVMDVHRLDFPDASFDLVTAGFVLHLLDDPAAAVREVRRVLTPGGRLSFAGPGPNLVDDHVLDLPNSLFAEFAAYLPPGGSMGRGFDEAEVLAGAGFVDVEVSHLEVRLPVPDGETLWRFFNTHGTKKFLDDLPPSRREDFRRRLVKGFEPGYVLHRTAWVYTARKPSR